MRVARLAGLGLCSVIGLLGVPAAFADQLSGRIEWKTRSATPAQAVVYAEPIDRQAAAVAGSAAIRHKNKTFLPHVIAVPAGSTIAFPNDDSIFHNAFSLSQPEPFDMGLYRAGESKQRLFGKPGVYYVFCNIHPQMAAFVVVTATPYVTVAAQDGAWRLDLPPGRYRVTALSERASPVTVEVTVSGASAAIGQTLDESAFVAAPHLNKFGKPYPKDAYKTP
jgi:plastocyanin